MKWLRSIFAAALLRVVGRYEGATFSPQRSYIPGGYQSVRFDTNAHSRAEIARKMRYFERNNTLVQALAGKFENFVVGSNPQVAPQSSDTEWNKRAKEWWDEWCQLCDIASRQSFGTILQLLARRWHIEGDAFIVLTYGTEVNGKRRPRIQLIEGHLCRTPPDLERDPDIHDGVRMDENGRPVAYYFAEEVSQGEYEFSGPTDADSVIPIFEPERPGEVRGMSHYHACINELHDLDDLHVLEMQAARENAIIRQFIKTATGEVDPVKLRRELLSRTNVGSTGESTISSKIAYYQEASGGKTVVMQHGDEIEQHGGERPSVTTTEYWKLKRELVCACVEIPFCIVFPDSMQGTVYRGALDMATASFRSRHSVIADAVRRIWGYVMGKAIGFDKRLADPPADWRNISIQAPRAPNVDIGRNATAEKEALADGRTNYDLIYGPLGLSWQVELKKLNEQLLFIKNECPAVAEMMAAQNPQPAQNPAPTQPNKALAGKIRQLMDDSSSQEVTAGFRNWRN